MNARAFAAVLLLLTPACSVPDIDPQPIQAPFTVSDYYVPSGFMGDASVLGRSVKPMDLSYEHCRPRPVGAHGDCYRFVYTPVPIADGGVGWAGVYWQSPANNWGQDAPQKMQPNATRVAFFAAGGAGDENAMFLAAGLSATDADGAPLPYVDSFKAQQSVTLSAELTRYEIALPEGVGYDHVTGGFGFSLTAVGPAAQTLFLDDVRWLP
jgi:hypothetical protein